MKEKIILEVVPWVNYSLRSGWKVESKKEILAMASTEPAAPNKCPIDDFVGFTLIIHI